MSEQEPRTYPEWRPEAPERLEDAAYAFGYYLIRHCRDEALATLPQGLSAEARAAAEAAVDTALHNVMDLCEGFWRLDSGPSHTLELVMSVRVQDSRGEPVEQLDLSPCKLDLPIGYWVWARERSFRSDA